MAARAATSAMSQAAPDPADRVEIGDAADPVDPVEPAKPVDEAEAAEAADPAGAAQPADQIEIAQGPLAALPVQDPIMPVQDAVMPEKSEATVPQTPPSAVPASLPVPVGTPSLPAQSNVFELVAEAHAALARGVDAMNDELASFARQSIDAGASTAIQMLAIRTWSDAVAVNTRFARTSYDHWLDSAAKVSELGVKLVCESSQPFVARFGTIWSAVHA